MEYVAVNPDDRADKNKDNTDPDVRRFRESFRYSEHFKTSKNPPQNIQSKVFLRYGSRNPIVVRQRTIEYLPISMLKSWRLKNLTTVSLAARDRSDESSPHYRDWAAACLWATLAYYLFAINFASASDMSQAPCTEHLRARLGQPAHPLRKGQRRLLAYSWQSTKRESLLPLSR